MVYPALLPLMRTPRLPVIDWTDAPADLNGLVRFAERRNMVSAHVPSHFKRSLIDFRQMCAFFFEFFFFLVLSKYQRSDIRRLFWSLDDN